MPQDVHYNWEYDEHAHAPDAPLREREARSVERDRAPRLVDRRRPREGAAARRGHRHLRHADLAEARRAREIEQLRHEAITWQLCQFLHGEQGALLATAQIVDSVPWYEGKQYGATQVMDEARHVEVYRRFIQEKLGHEYPVNPELKKLLDQILADSRWDMKFLGMQIIVEGLALAAFGTIRDTTIESAAAGSHGRGDGGRVAPRRVRRALAARVLRGPARGASATSARSSSTRRAC